MAISTETMNAELSTIMQLAKTQKVDIDWRNTSEVMDLYDTCSAIARAYTVDTFEQIISGSSKNPQQ